MTNPENLRVTRARLAVVTAVALAAATPGMAFAQWPANPFDAIAQARAALSRQAPSQSPSAPPTAFEQGVRAELRGDFPQALARYEEAVDNAGRSMPMLVDEQLRSTLPAQARVALVLGKLDEAEGALDRLDALVPTPQPTHGGAGFAQVRRTFGALHAFAQASSRSMNQRNLVEGDADVVAAIDAALAYRLPATDVPVALRAELRARQGRADEVARLWNEEYPAWRARDAQVGGPDMPFLADVPAIAAWRIGLSLEAVHDFARARDALETALSLDRKQMADLASTSSSVDELLGIFQQQRWIAASALDLALRSGQPADAEWALGAIASAKALPNRYIERRGALLAAMNDRASRNALSTLRSLDAQLLRSASSDDQGALAWLAWVNGYGEALRPVTPQLVRDGLPALFEPGDALLRRVRQRLGPDEAVIGYFQFQPIESVAAKAGPWRYARYSLTANGVTLADVGSKTDLDRLVQHWRHEHDDHARAAIAALLGRGLLAHIPPEAVSARRWIIDPDGLLALMPFEALPDADSRLTLERRSVRYLTSLAQLADQSSALPTMRTHAVILADPLYESANPPARLLPESLAQNRQLREAVLLPLPETRAEAAAVSASLDKLGIRSDVLLGKDATPDALRAVDAPAFVHVASHGFVLAPAVDGDSQARVRSRMVVPGLLAGLMLSPDHSGAVFSGVDLAALNLHGTRLVVLSACDTGDGSQDAHEGLSSLRRAAEEAGARATVTSLWPVSSTATAKLMAAFYDQLAAGASNSDALRAAKMQSLRAGASVEEWAGFVLAGAER